MKHFALMAASAATGDWIVFAATGDFGFVHLDETGQRAAIRGKHAAAQFGAEQPRRLVGAQSKLALELQRRDAIEPGLAGNLRLPCRAKRPASSRRRGGAAIPWPPGRCRRRPRGLIREHSTPIF